MLCSAKCHNLSTPLVSAIPCSSLCKTRQTWGTATVLGVSTSDSTFTYFVMLILWRWCLGRTVLGVQNRRLVQDGLLCLVCSFSNLTSSLVTWRLSSLISDSWYPSDLKYVIYDAWGGCTSVPPNCDTLETTQSMSITGCLGVTGTSRIWCRWKSQEMIVDYSIHFFVLLFQFLYDPLPERTLICARRRIFFEVLGWDELLDQKLLKFFIWYLLRPFYYWSRCQRCISLNEIEKLLHGRKPTAAASETLQKDVLSEPKPRHPKLASHTTRDRNAGSALKNSVSRFFCMSIRWVSRLRSPVANVQQIFSRGARRRAPVGDAVNVWLKGPGKEYMEPGKGPNWLGKTVVRRLANYLILLRWE